MQLAGHVCVEGLRLGHEEAARLRQQHHTRLGRRADHAQNKGKGVRPEEGGKTLGALLFAAQENEKGNDVEDSRDDEPGNVTPKIEGQLRVGVDGEEEEAVRRHVEHGEVGLQHSEVLGRGVLEDALGGKDDEYYFIYTYLGRTALQL